MIYNYFFQLGKIVANFISTILLFFIAISAIKLISIIISMIKTYRQEFRNIERLKSGTINTEDLHNLSPREFEYWSANFLEKQGFTNINVTCSGADGGKDIICEKNDEIYYVECKRYSNSQKAYFHVDEEIVRKLIGAMEGDKIKNGILITTGIITKDALDYISSLPESYSLTVYDGKALVNEYNSLVNPTLVNALS